MTVSRTVRRSVLTLFAALTAVVGVAALAWACTPQAYLYLSPTSVEPSSEQGGTAGATVTVTGTGFVPGPVQISLDAGPTLATATGPEFSVAVRVPATAAAGVHYLRGVAYQPDGTVAGEASRALLVRAVTEQRPAERPARRTAPRPERTEPQAQQARPAEPVKPAVSVPEPARSQVTQATAATAPSAPADATTPVRPRRQPAAKPRTSVTRRHSVRALPSPESRATLPAAPRGAWAATVPRAADSQPATGAPAWATLVGVGLIGLGLGAAGAALVMGRRRPQAPVPAVVPPPDPAPEAPSLEAELEQLLAKGPSSASPGGVEARR